MARQRQGGASREERLKAWAITVGTLIPFCFLAGIVGEIAGTYLNTGFVVVALLSGVCLLGFYFIVRRQVSIITRDKTRDFIYFFAWAILLFYGIAAVLYGPDKRCARGVEPHAGGCEGLHLLPG